MLVEAYRTNLRILVFGTHADNIPIEICVTQSLITFNLHHPYFIDRIFLLLQTSLMLCLDFSFMLKGIFDGGVQLTKIS